MAKAAKSAAAVKVPAKAVNTLRCTLYGMIRMAEEAGNTYGLVQARVSLLDLAKADGVNPYLACIMMHLAWIAHWEATGPSEEAATARRIIDRLEADEAAGIPYTESASAR